jgi:hypothetical protein
MDSDTGVLLTRAGYTSVLLPLTIAEQAVSGYEIGIPTAQSRTTLYAAFGATFPDTVNGFIMLDGTLQGQNDIGLAGASGSLTPQSGTGPFYLDMNGDPAPAATSTSTYSLILFAGVAPSTTYVGSLTPITMSCYEGFGGWSVAQIDATRFPVVAGFETHVGLTCHN